MKKQKFNSCHTMEFQSVCLLTALPGVRIHYFLVQGGIVTGGIIINIHVGK